MVFSALSALAFAAALAVVLGMQHEEYHTIADQ